MNLLLIGPFPSIAEASRKRQPRFAYDCFVLSRDQCEFCVPPASLRLGNPKPISGLASLKPHTGFLTLAAHDDYRQIFYQPSW